MCLPSACAPLDKVDKTAAPDFELRVDSQRSALLSVHGTAPDDVWAVGADDGDGPVVLHFDGERWQRLATGLRGDLWWVQAISLNVVYFGGSDAHLIEYRDGQFTRLPTPGLGRHTVFGLWAAGENDVYAVGAEAGRNGFIWHYDGDSVENLALPSDLLPTDGENDTPGLFKIWGNAAGELWIVGDRGVALRGNTNDGFKPIERTPQTTLFTVAGNVEHVVAVGGDNQGTLITLDSNTAFEQATPSLPLQQGVFVTREGTVWTSGQEGSVYRSTAKGMAAVEQQVVMPASDSLHAIWVDNTGGVWAVGGNVLTPALDRGVLLHRNSPDGVALDQVPATFIVERDPESIVEACPVEQVDPAPHGSIARRWNEQLLWAVRRDIPRPTVHARNLYHLSIALWDANAAYDASHSGIMLNIDALADREAPSEEALVRERDETLTYAAYTLLQHRYARAQGGPVSTLCFDAFMRKLGHATDTKPGSSSKARNLGLRIAEAIIQAFADDGANEDNGYADPDDFAPDQPRLVVDLPGTKTETPTTWQQLSLAKAETQNGIAEGSGVRDYVGAHWGAVTPFALPADAASQNGPLDTGEPPLRLNDDLARAALQVLAKTAELDFEDGKRIDISPGALGNNTLGDDDGSGYVQNPVTGSPYAPQSVYRGDFTRVMAEFWADGPTSETPPGHWNTLANQVADSAGFERRLFGEGPELSALAYDVHLYLALNGALHDAAIAAWGLKRAYLTARPITLIRHMGGLGQRSNAASPSYHPDGLPLQTGLVEVISDRSSQPGQRHAHLRRYLGDIAVRSYLGEPGDRDNEVGGIGWLLAKRWTPYQRRTFVTPAFPGYISGHSTFSRAGAEVLTAITGSPYFPGGLGTHRVEPGYLVFEYGPSEAIELQWATYYDAADQAGQSRLWGGIHVRHDDYDGRKVGAQVGAWAMQRATELFVKNP